MSLDDVDLQVLLLDRFAAARNGARGSKDDTVEAAIADAMGGAS